MGSIIPVAQAWIEGLRHDEALLDRGVSDADARGIYERAIAALEFWHLLLPDQGFDEVLEDIKTALALWRRARLKVVGGDGE